MKRALILIVLLVLCNTLSIAQPNRETYLEDIKSELQKKWPHNRSVNFIFHGHSVPTGYTTGGVVRTFDGYPMQSSELIVEKYPTGVLIPIITSIGGENAEQGAARFEEEVLCHRGDIIFIDYGLNDRPIGLERAKKAWESMIKAAQGKGLRVVLMTPTPDTTEDILDPSTPLCQHAEQIKALAREYDCLIVDAYSAFKEIAESGEELKGYMAQNNHPNKRGHRVVAQLIYELF
ncbi:MAG: SGNH/GDSL hydrolase family protein [Rikenellaceae bacterium]